ncbi:restriction-modification enzyme MpuUVI S subunit [Ureaplasma urealyticum serovar 2 str. ATCC 27814]|uniref:restriction endonuclease subunit S n=1 Tax=Ureaplasma urealyticum TaxID=2130 RepID=UPI0001981E32|nr:restriction endonuclease subunit S [Ureaplasma urealyticum]EEH02261.1 restriction-modification enzyme MpuUVI S subunit [Ureaplasma urealyticum serovar 2 str. ATCC 27814]
MSIKLKDIIYAKRGSTITSNEFKINPGSYPLISASAQNNGVFGYINSYMYEGGHITISMNGNAGCVFYQKDKFSANSDVLVLSNIDNKISNNKFIFYWLKKHENTKIKSLCKGTTRLRLSNDDVLNLEINLPPIEEQNAIISIIEPIEKSIKTINLLQTKIGLFIEKTFNFINDNLVNSDLIEFSLKDLLNIKRGLPITAKDLLNNPGSYPLISASSKNNGIFGYFNDYMYDGKNITISMNGNAGCIFYQIGKFSANSDVLVLSNSNKNLTNIDYIYYLLKTKEKEIQNLAIGTTRFRLGNSVIEKFKVLLPNIEIQEKFSKIVEPLLNLSTKANKIEKNLNECLLKIVKKLIV